MAFSTPILRVPATISTDSTSPITPNATRNGTHGAMLCPSRSLTVSQEPVPSTAPAGSAWRTAATPAFTAPLEPALANR